MGRASFDPAAVSLSRADNGLGLGGSRYTPSVVTYCASMMHRVSGSQAQGRLCVASYWLFRLLARHISRTLLFQENRHFSLHALVVLKPLISGIGRLVACVLE